MKYLFRACLIAALSIVAFNSPSRSEDKTTLDSRSETPTAVGISDEDSRARFLWDQYKSEIAATTRTQTVPSEQPSTRGQSNREKVRSQDIEWVTHTGEVTTPRSGAARQVLSIDGSRRQTGVIGFLVGSSKSGGYLAVEVGKSNRLKIDAISMTSSPANSPQLDAFGELVEFQRTVVVGPQTGLAKLSMAPEAPLSCKISGTNTRVATWRQFSAQRRP